MVNRRNNGVRFPELEIANAVSPDVYAPNHSADASPAARMLGQAADSFGQSLHEMATREAVQRGKAEAAADVRAGNVRAVDEGTVFGDAYTRVAKDAMASQRAIAIQEELGKAFIQHQDDPGELDKAFNAVRKGFAPTPFEDVNLRSDQVFDASASDYRVKAQGLARKRLIEQGQANFQTAYAGGQALLDQAASGAAMDEGGAQRVSQAFTLFMGELAKYGPKGAFTVAGVEFAEDPERLGVLSPEELGRSALAAQTQARSIWIMGAADRVTTADGKRDFAVDLRTRWRGGDPAFALLDGVTIEKVANAIDADADRLDTDARALRSEAGANARDAIEAVSWGAVIDVDQLLEDAEASGDVGLIARARLVAQADPNALLTEDAARVLGITPEPDAWFNGGGGGGAQAPRGIRNRNPGNVRPLTGGRLWAGQIGVDSGGFAVFRSMADGVAAAKTNLRSYGKRGVDTVSEIINRWAPSDAPEGNETQAYIKAVATRLGIDPNQKLDMTDDRTLSQLSDAMFRFENGPAYRVAGGASGPPDAFIEDPLDYARGGKGRAALVTVSPLQLDAYLERGEPVAAWGQALRSRRAAGQQLAAASGRGVRILTNAERTYYKGQLEEPGQALRLTAGFVGALGERGAADVLREIGGAPDANAGLLHLADLAIAGSGFPDRAVRGWALRATGTKLDKADGDSLAAAFAEHDTALAAVAGVKAPARRVAEAALLADRAEGVERPMSYYVRSALGSVTDGGRAYGGPAQVAAGATIAPRWLASDMVDEAMFAFAKDWARSGIGPVHSNGQAARPETVAKLLPVLMPNGRYRLRTPQGTWAGAKNAQPFEVDFDAGREFLRGRLPAGSLRRVR